MLSTNLRQPNQVIDKESPSADIIQQQLVTAKRKALAVSQSIDLVCQTIDESISNQHIFSNFQKVYISKHMVMIIILSIVRLLLVITTHQNLADFMVCSFQDGFCQVFSALVLGFCSFQVFEKYPKQWFANGELTPKGREWVCAVITNHIEPETTIGAQLANIQNRERRFGISLREEKLQTLKLWASEKNNDFKKRLQIYENILPVADLLTFSITTLFALGPLMLELPIQFLH